VAGGSGLAPILAILHDALAAGVARPVTLVFGAREEQDLYALEEIAAIARAWRGPFRFVPVLSACPHDARWEGERGLVSECMAARIEPGAHAYVCGSPAMIDACLDVLQHRGVPRAHVHFDRFTTQADVLARSQAEVPGAAGLVDYLKYAWFLPIGAVVSAATFAGGRLAIGVPALIVALIVFGDAFLGDDVRAPYFTRPRVLTALLWASVPLMALVAFACVWMASPGDPLGAGAWLTARTGRDVLAERAASGSLHYFSVWFATGLMIGLIGTITGHELTHRTWDRVSMFVGRWLLAFSFDTSFAIEHVYGHHRHVATPRDPASAPRGRHVYSHIVKSTIGGNVSAWQIEVERLSKRGWSRWSTRNAFLRGHAMSVVLVAAAYALGGGRAALFFAACMLWGKALLEIVNYMEHYGLSRHPNTPVQPRHSWNTNRRVSSWILFNLTRHSHHHAQGEVPFHALTPYPDAPKMFGGYLTTILATLVPPLWFALMRPRLATWDRDFATPEERRLAARAAE
jgi:fatty-acid desaturase